MFHLPLNSFKRRLGIRSLSASTKHFVEKLEFPSLIVKVTIMRAGYGITSVRSYELGLGAEDAVPQRLLDASADFECAEPPLQVVSKYSWDCVE